MKTTDVNMMWLWLNRARVVLVCLFLPLSVAYSQTVEIKEPVLRDFFCDKYEVAMNEDCSQLDTAILNSTFTEPQLIRLNRTGIKDVSELVFFKTADTLFLRHNGITTIPTDLRDWFPIDRLDLGDNELTEVPEFLCSESNANLGIVFLYLWSNNISSLPATWELNNSVTQVIEIDTNRISDLPSFTEFSELRRLRVRMNFLDFRDLVQVKSAPRYSSDLFKLFPQRPFDLALSQFEYFKGDSLEIDVNRSLVSNHYFLLKDGQPIDSNRTGKFTIHFNENKDFDFYSIRIRNDEFEGADDFLESKEYYFFRKEVEKQNVIIFSPNNDGVEDDLLIEGEGDVLIVNELGQQIKLETLPYIWKGDDANGQIIAPGLFFIRKENGETIPVLIAY